MIASAPAMVMKIKFVLLDSVNALLPAYQRSKGGKKSVKLLYRWVSDNEARIRRMSFRELMDALRKEGIAYHSYCAVS